MIRVMLVEDQKLMLGALVALLELEGDLQVVSRAHDGRAALDQLRELGADAVDVLVTDIEMPSMTGLDLCAAVRSQDSSPKVIILTTFARAGYLKRAMESGADGYLLKDGPVHSLAAAIRDVASGGKVVDPQLAAEAWAAPDPLNHREKQVLRHAETGANTRQIAETLGLTVGTVRNYLSSAIQKLEADNRVDAARLARSKGWI